MIAVPRPIRQALLWVALTTVSLLLVGVSAAGASTAQEESQGAEVLRELEAGKTQCGDLSDEDFEHVGDYSMGRMLGSTSRHEAMDETMTRMMGGLGEGGPPYERERGEGGRPYGPSGSMMEGGYWNESSGEDNGSDGPSAAAMVGMMAVLIGAVAVAVLLLSRRRPRGPLDTLKRRFAAGELSSDEYEERRRLLGGS